MAINIKSFVRSGVVSIFQHLEDLVEEVRIVETIGDQDNKGAYNPLTGEFEVLDSHTQRNEYVDAIRLDLDLKDGDHAPSREIDGENVEVATSKFLIQEKDFVDIWINNYSKIYQFKYSSGIATSEVKTVWRVIQTNLDPTGSFYEIFVREAT